MEKTTDIKTFIISSKILKQDRVINAWRPKEFNNQSLPILYLLDGGLNEKFNEIKDLLEHLIKQNTIKPIQLIGIENIGRNYDFTQTTTVRKDRKWVPKYGNAPRFKRFIIEELIPTIDTKFNTNQENSIVGESLGGLFVMDLMYHHLEHFQGFISIDPSLWWNNHQLFEEFLNSFDIRKLESKKIWISASKTQSISIYTDQFIKKIEQHTNSNLTVHYHKDSNQTHFTIFKSSVREALNWMFSK